MACGVPAIVSTNATSAVRPEADGLVFPTGNVIALKLALRRLCCNPELRRKMGMAARQRAESLRWDLYLANLGRIYRALGEYARTRREEVLQPVMTGF